MASCAWAVVRKHQRDLFVARRTDLCSTHLEELAGKVGQTSLCGHVCSPEVDLQMCLCGQRVVCDFDKGADCLAKKGWRGGKETHRASPNLLVRAVLSDIIRFGPVVHDGVDPRELVRVPSVGAGIFRTEWGRNRFSGRFCGAKDREAVGGKLWKKGTHYVSKKMPRPSQ